MAENISNNPLSALENFMAPQSKAELPIKPTNVSPETTTQPTPLEGFNKRLEDAVTEAKNAGLNAAEARNKVLDQIIAEKGIEPNTTKSVIAKTLAGGNLGPDLVNYLDLANDIFDRRQATK